MNPSQADKLSSSEMLKCKKIDFASALKDIIDSLKELIQNWCSICFQNFDNQKNHIKNTHSDKET